jgi:hypothetical protein
VPRGLRYRGLALKRADRASRLIVETLLSHCIHGQFEFLESSNSYIERRGRRLVPDPKSPINAAYIIFWYVRMGGGTFKF